MEKVGQSLSLAGNSLKSRHGEGRPKRNLICSRSTMYLSQEFISTSP
jgi:hypothetical protein